MYQEEDWWRGLQHPSTCSVVGAEPLSRGFCVVCYGRKKGRRQDILPSPLCLHRPQYSSVSIRLSVLFSTPPAECQCHHLFQEQEAGQSKVTMRTESGLAPQGARYPGVLVPGCHRRLVSNFWVSLLIECHAILPLIPKWRPFLHLPLDVL